MISLSTISFVLLLVVARVSCESYSKSCFLNYMLQKDLLDKTFEIYKNGEKVDARCEAAVNSTVSQLRASTNDICISDFYRRKLVSETLVKEYLMPQFRSSQPEVHFDDRFTAFKGKAGNLSRVICNNQHIFKPNLRAMMRNGRYKKDSKSKEIDCLQKYLMKKNKPLEEECRKIVEPMKEDFYRSTGNDMKRVFSPPNDNLVNLDCLAQNARKGQLFEKIFFFVVLAATKNMNDKQIDVLLRSAEGVITSSTRLMFECMI